jgi:hypothetical protein
LAGDLDEAKVQPIVDAEAEVSVGRASDTRTITI